MTDLVKRLRPHILCADDGVIYVKAKLLREAAAEIERLQAANAAMKEALERMVTDFGDSAGEDAESRDVIARARAALASPTGWPESVVELVAFVRLIAKVGNDEQAWLARRVINKLPASLKEAARHDR